MSLHTITSNSKMFVTILGEEFKDTLQSKSKKDMFEQEIIKRNTPNEQEIKTNSIISNQKRNNYDFDHMSDSSYKSEIYFQRPSKNKPHSFDYSKIFETTPKRNNDDKHDVQKMCLKALDDTVSVTTSACHQNGNSKYEKAVSKCTKSIFDGKVKAYEESIAKYLSNEAAESLRPLQQYPSSAYYNASDHTLMDQMLYDAFQCLRKNPKFVWVQLPDAHKVPSLREWIARRYGKEYSSKQRVSSFRKSCKLFPALGMTHTEIPIPNSNQIGKNHYLNYNCRNYLDKKVVYSNLYARDYNSDL